MHKTNVVEFVERAVKPTLVLLVEGKEYTVEYPLSSVIKAETKLGRSLKSPADWFCAKAEDLPALLEAGLGKHHPELTTEEVQAICEGIGPETYTEVTEALGALNFPHFLARYQEGLEKARKGGALPNAQSADAS